MLGINRLTKWLLGPSQTQPMIPHHSPEENETARRIRTNHRAISHLLQVSVTRQPERARPELKAEHNQLALPFNLCATLQEGRVYRSGPKASRVALGKVVYHQFQNFDQKIFRGDRIWAVALMGRDETGQLWQHFLPDDYMYRRLGDCERYLAQAGPYDEVITE